MEQTATQLEFHKNTIHVMTYIKILSDLKKTFIPN